MSKPPSPDQDPQVSTVYDNTTAITDNYEAIAYDARPNPVSHPDHVAAVATMFGFTAPEVTHVRVLELGCSDGANLLPVVATLPDSQCVGCDIAPTAIRRAREATAPWSAQYRMVCL